MTTKLISHLKARNQIVPNTFAQLCNPELHTRPLASDKRIIIFAGINL